LPKENDRKEGWLRRLEQSRTFYEAIAVALLAVVIGNFHARWTEEIGAHQKTTARLERAEERLVKQTPELENLRKKNEELERLHPILQFYGTHAKIIRSFDLKKEVGSRLTIGNCPQTPCFVFAIQQIRDDLARLAVGDIGEGAPHNNLTTIGLTLKKGCRTDFQMSEYAVDFVIEDDRIHALSAGIGISIASSPTEGLTLGTSTCP